MNLLERFWVKVQIGGPEDCWRWTAATDPAGYGRFKTPTGTVLAHRFAYEHMVAEIPDGQPLDHLCRVHDCVNPYHLEPVTTLVNSRRGIAGKRQAGRTHCPRGHAYTEPNTYIIPGSGSRVCITCRQEQSRRRVAEQKRARSAA